MKFSSYCPPNFLLLSVTWNLVFVLSCGAPENSDFSDQDYQPYKPSQLVGKNRGSGRGYERGRGGDRNGADIDPRNYGESGDEIVSGGSRVDPAPPPGLPGGDPTEGPSDPGTGGPPPPPAMPGGPVATPEQFEGVWSFYQYCVIAEDRVEAMNFIELFESPEFFEAWLSDIQVTVAAIRLRLPYPQDGRVPQENCRDAYNVFRSKILFDLSPDSLKNERFDIVNIDPISGLPNLRSLNLRDNKIVDMTFLRNLSGLKFLDVGVNLIEVIPSMRRGNTSGLVHIEELGLEYQGEEFSDLNIMGVAQLYQVQSFKLLRIKGNKISPAGLRFLPSDFRVSSTRVLQFILGSDSCDVEKWGFRYPDQIEHKRLDLCEAR
jgi:hypothetical protein